MPPNKLSKDQDKNSLSKHQHS